MSTTATNMTFTPDPNGFAETKIGIEKMLDCDARSIREYQRAVFGYEMSKRVGNHAEAAQFASSARRIASAYAGKHNEVLFTKLRDEVLRIIRQMEVK